MDNPPIKVKQKVPRPRPRRYRPPSNASIKFPLPPIPKKTIRPYRGSSPAPPQRPVEEWRNQEQQVYPPQTQVGTVGNPLPADWVSPVTWGTQPTGAVGQTILPTESGIQYPTSGGMAGGNTEILEYARSGRFYPDEPYQFPPQEEEQFIGQYVPSYNAETNPDEYNPGYEPSFWQNPRNVAITYNKIKSGQIDPWMDTDFITQAYDYFKLANGSDDWTNWKYLSPNDPALGYLQSGTPPPLDYYLPPEKFQEVLFYDLYQTPAEQRDPNFIAALAPGYRWILENEQQARQYQAWVEGATPDWLRIANVAMTDPAWNGALSMGGMGLILSGGNLVAAAGGALIGGATGLASKIENPMLSSMAGGAVLGGTLLAPTGIGMIPGAMIGAGAGLIYGSVTGSSLADWVLSKMMLPSEMLEQGIGTAYQIGQSAVNPQEFGTVLDVLGNLKGTLEASRLTYETLSQPRGVTPWINVLPELDYLFAHMRGDTEEMNRIKFAKPGETFSLQNGPLPYAINASQAAVFTGARRAILAGVDPDQVQMYYTNLLGLPGEMANLGGMLVLNPLFVASRAESAAMRQFGRAIDSKAIVEGWSGRTGRGFFGGLKNYKSMVETGLVGKLSEMSSFEKTMAGLTDKNIPKIYDPDYHILLKGDGNSIASKNAILRWADTQLMMTPEARARSFVGKVFEFFNGTSFNYYNQGADVEGLVKAFEAVGKSPASAVSDLGLKTLGSPIAYASQRVFSVVSPKFRTMLDLFNSKGMERELLLKVSRITGEKPQAILDLLANNKGDTVFGKLTEALRLSEDPIAQQLLAEIDAKAFTVDALKPITDAFTGDSTVPWHPKALVVQMGKTLMEASGDWSAKAFGVAEPKAIYRLSNTFKSAQSLLLLGLNPAYFVNNSVNNIISRIATGVFGFDITNQRQ